MQYFSTVIAEYVKNGVPGAVSHVAQLITLRRKNGIDATLVIGTDWGECGRDQPVAVYDGRKRLALLAGTVTKLHVAQTDVGGRSARVQIVCLVISVLIKRRCVDSVAIVMSHVSALTMRIVYRAASRAPNWGLFREFCSSCGNDSHRANHPEVANVK